MFSCNESQMSNLKTSTVITLLLQFRPIITSSGVICANGPENKKMDKMQYLASSGFVYCHLYVNGLSVQSLVEHNFDS